MMQQQNFLMNPIWQESMPAAKSERGADARPRRQEEASSLAPAAGNAEQRQRDEELANSKKVIKLLKSYSHIHQVDDSDDQIRGTYTRLSSYRPEGGEPRAARNQRPNQEAR